MEIIRGWIREPPISYSYTLAGSDAPPLEIGGESDNRLLSVRHGHAERAAVKAGVRLHANQSSATWLALLLTLSLAQTHDDVLCWYGLSFAGYFFALMLHLAEIISLASST